MELFQVVCKHIRPLSTTIVKYVHQIYIVVKAVPTVITAVANGS